MRPPSLLDAVKRYPERIVLVADDGEVSARSLWRAAWEVAKALPADDDGASVVLAGVGPLAAAVHGMAAELAGRRLMAMPPGKTVATATMARLRPVLVVIGSSVPDSERARLAAAAPEHAVFVDEDSVVPPDVDEGGPPSAVAEWEATTPASRRRRLESGWQLQSARMRAIGVPPFSGVRVAGVVCDPPVLTLVLAVLQAGGRVEAGTRPCPVAAFVGTPATMGLVASHVEAAGSRPVTVLCAGGPCPEADRRRLEAAGCAVYEVSNAGGGPRVTIPLNSPSAGFWHRARTQPEALAVWDDGAVATAGEVLARAHATAHGLRARGLEAGAIVAVPTAAMIEFFELYLATAQTGLVLAPINPGLPQAAAADMVRALRPSLVVGPPEAWKAVGAQCDVVSAAELRDGQPQTPPSDRMAGDILFHTSGTTGAPKGVMRQEHAQEPEALALGYRVAASCLGFDRPGVHLACGAMWSGGPLSMALAALHAGSTLVAMPAWSPQRALELIESQRVTSTFMVPAMLESLLRVPPEERFAADVSSLRAVVHGAGPCPVDVKQELMDWLGPVLFEHYSSSEAAGTFVTPTEWLRRPGTVGRPFPGVDVRVVGEDGADAPTGAEGKVLLTHGGFSYIGAADGEHAPGYTWVGDLGRLDEEGWLYLSGREAELIKVAGVRVHAAAVENALAGHPSVAAAAAVGVPHARLGERIALAVELRPGWRPSSELRNDLKHFARRRLTMPERPGRIVFVDELPRDALGTIDRVAVRALIGRAGRESPRDHEGPEGELLD